MSSPAIFRASLWLALLLLFGTSPLSARTMDEIFNEAAAHLQEGNYDAALAKYKEAVAQDPKSPLAYNLLGMAYRFKYSLTRHPEDRKLEIGAFESAVALDPAYWVAQLNLGLTYYYTGDKQKAAPYFRKALELYPDHPEKMQYEKMIAEGEQKPGPAQPPAPAAEAPKTA